MSEKASPPSEFRATDIPIDPIECLRRYINLWPDAPKDEYVAAVEALAEVERLLPVLWTPPDRKNERRT